ncbi:hypothetical protein P4O66_017849 [Electrophorus voltai]|uniref:Gypsy retrotransposon integrase-like protein 1 n=1 Tax=Electrophorus voltai TaxID=2609070 RepID=A0AAD8YU95_9TELE|nr:hypothetical protein P4O66_017849 [Electrophorus voltai]
MEFRTLVAGTHWNEPAQIDVFVNGLRADLQADLACRLEGKTLNGVVHLAITYDRLLQERRRCVQREAPQRTETRPAWQTNIPEEPMLLDAAGVQRGGGGNSRVSCSSSCPMFKVLVQVSCKGHVLSPFALVDSGATGNVMDWGFARRLGIKAIALPSSLSIQALDEGPVGPDAVGKKQIQQWAPSCYRRCFLNKAVPLQATSIESPEARKQMPIPLEYQDLEQVFSPSKATWLPPHLDWDCAVTLKEGVVPPRCRIYPLSQEEERVMAQYIKEALQQGYVRPSTSLASAGVFFIKQRDGGLRPCVDYRGLNKLLVQYPYPLPLVPAALEQLKGARYFTKLDLHSAYNQIWIKEGDEWKTAFSTSTGHYEYLVLPYSFATALSIFQAYINEVLREFLGRSVVTYIDDILIYFPPSWNQHVLDVQAMLQTLLQNHLYCKAEKCEFHRKEVDFLGYAIQQGCFKVTYRPGEKNTRVDALSRQYTAEAQCPSSELVLSPTCFLASLEWELDRKIKAANPHPQCSANRFYVPPAHRGALITWAHTSLRTGRPGASRTAQLIGVHYWWTAMPKDVVRYVVSCPNCAPSKKPWVPPAGKLLPLPTSHQPWSHLEVDFVNDLPVSEGNTTILSVVDQFSKMVRFLPLVALPTALKTADLLFRQVFRQSDLPEDIVSDRGPWFTSRVWKELLGKLNITVGLTSGYHPQANGQMERVNQELGKFLYLYCNHHSEQNSMQHMEMGLTPFECVLCYQPPLYPWNIPTSDQPAVHRWCRESEQTWEETH